MTQPVDENPVERLRSGGMILPLLTTPRTDPLATTHPIAVESGGTVEESEHPENSREN